MRNTNEEKTGKKWTENLSFAILGTTTNKNKTTPMNRIGLSVLWRVPIAMCTQHTNHVMARQKVFNAYFETTLIIMKYKAFEHVNKLINVGVDFWRCMEFVEPFKGNNSKQILEFWVEFFSQSESASKLEFVRN